MSLSCRSGCESVLLHVRAFMSVHVHVCLDVGFFLKFVPAFAQISRFKSLVRK